VTIPVLEDFTAVAREKLTTGVGPHERLAAWHAVVTHAEAELSRLEVDTSLIDCGPGCASCCVVNVNILEPEALAIVAFLEANLPASGRPPLRERLGKLHQQTCWLDDEERMMVRKPCAFLDGEKRCTIHPVRPLLCRSLTSTDARRCHEAVAMLALGESPQIVCNLEQKALFEQAYLGLAAALDAHGLDSSSYRLTGLLHRLCP